VIVARPRLAEVVAEASRAPSAHNAQPARWQFLGNEVVLLEDVRRRLPVSDPTGRDHRMSLGAAFEGLHLALTQVGLGLGQAHLMPGRPVNGLPHLRSVARARLKPTRRPSLLALHVGRRRTHRGRFLPATPEHGDRLAGVLAADPYVVTLGGAPTLRALSGLGDRCTVDAFSQPGYIDELRDWLRLSPSDPRSRRDGLTAACLGLTGIECDAARLGFRPRLFALLCALGLGRLLVSEAGPTRSAAAVALLLAPEREDPFETGRRLYRLWLRVTGAGFQLCPMSSVADTPRGLAGLRELAPTLGANANVVSVLRIGVAPAACAFSSPRLPVAELMVP
jgi:hypothetical protein